MQQAFSHLSVAFNVSVRLSILNSNWLIVYDLGTQDWVIYLHVRTKPNLDNSLGIRSIFSHFLKASAPYFISAITACIHQKLYGVKCRNLLFMNKMVYDLHSVQLQKFGKCAVSISLQPLDTKPLWHVLFLYSLFVSSGQYTHRPQILSPLLKECPNLAMARGRSSFVNVYLYIRQIIYIQRTKSIPFSEILCMIFATCISGVQNDRFEG